MIMLKELKAILGQIDLKIVLYDIDNPNTPLETYDNYVDFRFHGDYNYYAVKEFGVLCDHTTQEETEFYIVIEE